MLMVMHREEEKSWMTTHPLAAWEPKDEAVEYTMTMLQASFAVRSSTGMCHLAMSL
jgi:hypothetical protein